MPLFVALGSAHTHTLNSWSWTCALWCPKCDVSISQSVGLSAGGTGLCSSLQAVAPAVDLSSFAITATGLYQINAHGKKGGGH